MNKYDISGLTSSFLTLLLLSLQGNLKDYRTLLFFLMSNANYEEESDSSC